MQGTVFLLSFLEKGITKSVYYYTFDTLKETQMKTTLLAVSISSCLFFACSNSSDSSNTESTLLSDSALQNNVPVGADPTVQAPSADNSQMIGAPVPPPTGQSTQSQPVTTTAPGMNPPHGAPGHRCDLAVGAPLNSSPEVAPAQFSSPAPSLASPSAVPSSAPAIAPAAATSPTTTAPGMNPPHGEPGHDCSIAVGAPLKK